MRGEILFWSSVSGAVLGLFAGVGAIALGVLLAAVLPAAGARAVERLLPAALVLGLGICPPVGALLGFLEGRLKLH